MPTAVLLSRVPDTASRISVAAGGTAIDEGGLKFVLNPYDEFALEAALQRREQGGTGEVVVLACGGDAVQEQLRTALAMGADRAVQLRPAAPGDTAGVARAFADAVAPLGADLVLTGKMTVDDHDHALVHLVAAHLGWASVTAAATLAVEGSILRASREVEGAVEHLEAALPAVVSCEKGLNTPRIPKLQGIMAAKKKPLEVRDVALAAPRVQVRALRLPPERAPGRIVGEGAAAVPQLVELLAAEAKVL